MNVVTTLDDWAEQHGVDHIDMLWLDLQGFEYQVLKACPKILKTVKALQVEFSVVPFYEGTILYDDLRDFLIENGFAEIAKDENVLGGDAIFHRISPSESDR